LTLFFDTCKIESMKIAVEKNKAIVLLKKAEMPMNEIIRAFGDNDRGSDKFNYYRVWRRDKDKYNLPKVGKKDENNSIE